MHLRMLSWSCVSQCLWRSLSVSRRLGLDADIYILPSYPHVFLATSVFSGWGNCHASSPHPISPLLRFAESSNTALCPILPSSCFSFISPASSNRILSQAACGSSLEQSCSEEIQMQFHRQHWPLAECTWLHEHKPITPQRPFGERHMSHCERLALPQSCDTGYWSKSTQNWYEEIYIYIYIHKAGLGTKPYVWVQSHKQCRATAATKWQGKAEETANIWCLYAATITTRFSLQNVVHTILLKTTTLGMYSDDSSYNQTGHKRCACACFP